MTTIDSPDVDVALREAGRPAGRHTLGAGLAHALFAGGGLLLGTATTAIQSYEYEASVVAAYRWAGIVQSLLTMVWAAAFTLAVLALGRLVWRSGSLAASVNTAVAVSFGTLVALTGGLALSLYSGATTDLMETHADVPTQQAVMQGVWIVLHGGWYAASWITAAWLVWFALAARRSGIFRTLGLVLTLLAAISVVAIIVMTSYPTSLAFVSLYLLILGIVLLVRTRRLLPAGPVATGE